MKTIIKEVKVYQFDELTEEAKQNAINKYSERQNFDYIYDEAYQTVKKANKLFNIEEGRNSWLYYSLSHIDDNIMNLKGLRLRTYILNNFELWKGKFYDSIGDNRIINHPCIKVHRYDLSKGARVSSSNFYYSRIQKENCCILTGMCYDDDFLKPIYDFVYNFREFPSANYQTFEDLIQYCFDSLKSSIESEIEYRESREAIEEEIQENCMEFTEDGNEF